MEGARRRTRHKRRRGGMSTEDENKFLEKKRKERNYKDISAVEERPIFTPIKILN